MRQSCQFPNDLRTLSGGAAWATQVWPGQIAKNLRPPTVAFVPVLKALNNLASVRDFKSAGKDDIKVCEYVLPLWESYAPKTSAGSNQNLPTPPP